MAVVHSLWISKLRYGIQLCTKVSVSTNDTISGVMKSLQLTQNRLLRSLNGSMVKDKISVKSMLEKFELLSVNQLSAEIKLVEGWKIVNIEGHPLTLDPYNHQAQTSHMELRLQPTRVFNDTYKLQRSSHSFNIEASRLWNLAPAEIRSAPTLAAAKTAIRKYAKSLPV